MVRIWNHFEDSEGRSYFFCGSTHESSWELPEQEEDWLETTDPKSGRKFYFSGFHDLSTWQDPSCAALSHDGKMNSKNDFVWLECIDSSSGRTFYYHLRDRRSVWEKPSFEDENDDMEVEIEETKMETGSDGEYHDYVLKEGGGTTMFGRRSWKRRFLVVKHGEMGFFHSYKEYVSGELPIKGVWTQLDRYRLEEMLQDDLGIRLLPLNTDTLERVWNIRCEDADKKMKLMNAMSPHTISRSFMKTLERELSGRRFWN